MKRPCSEYFLLPLYVDLPSLKDLILGTYVGVRHALIIITLSVTLKNHAILLKSRSGVSFGFFFLGLGMFVRRGTASIMAFNHITYVKFLPEKFRLHPKPIVFQVTHIHFTLILSINSYFYFCVLYFFGKNTS